MLGDILWQQCSLFDHQIPFGLDWSPASIMGLWSCCPVLLICIVPHLLTSYNGSNLHVALHVICITLGPFPPPMNIYQQSHSMEDAI